MQILLALKTTIW